MAQQSAVLDVREIPHRERHAVIFAALDALAEGAAVELINDHDPQPLSYQLAAVRPGQFSWDYQQEGPEVWKVQITKRCC
jgi:uncharacterized protein (DUF2249 family)